MPQGCEGCPHYERAERDARDSVKRTLSAMESTGSLASVGASEPCEGPNCNLLVTASADGQPQINVPDATRPAFGTFAYVYPSPAQAQIDIETEGVCAVNNTLVLEARSIR